MKACNYVALTVFAACGLAAGVEPYGLDAILRLDRLPYLSSGVSAGQQSSFDRTGGNNDVGTFLYTTPERVLLDLKGPGVVYCLWTTGFAAGDHLKFYFDGETQPRLDMSIANLFSGTNAPFLTPLAGNDTVSSGGFYSYVPLPFASSIKITTPSWYGYYHIGYHCFMPNTPVTSWSPTASVSSAVSLWRAACSDPKPSTATTLASSTFDLAANQTQTLLDVNGPRSIVSIRLNIPDLGNIGRLTQSGCASCTEALNGLSLRMCWDNETTPSVDAPIGDFFAMGHFGGFSTRSLMVGADTTNYLYCYLPMPFRQHGRIQLVSTRASATAGITCEIRHAASTDQFGMIGYFKTRFNHEVHTLNDGTDILFLDTAGAGKFLGVIESMKGNDRRYLEGDERIYVDNNRSPALHGTGTEDFYNAGWYFKFGTFSLPMQGNTAHAVDAGDKTAAYRFFLHDAVNFRTHIRASIEHGATNDFPVETWTLAYYYLKTQPLAQLSDSLDIGKPTDESAHSFTDDSPIGAASLTNTFEGEHDNVSITDDGRTSRGSCSFTMAITPVNNGVILRRMFDQNDLIQQAGVTVDGAVAGIWYHAGQNTTHRWREDEFMIPSTLTAGKSRITVALTHATGTPDWSAFKYWAYALTDTMAAVGVAPQARPAASRTQNAAGDRYTLSVFSMDGKVVRRMGIGDVEYRAGLSRTLRSSLPAGTYLCRLRGGTSDQSVAVTLTK